MSKKINEYVKKELDNNSTPGQVVETLVSAGWEKDDVEQALDEVLKRSNKEDEVEKGNDVVHLFLLALTVFIMGLMIIGIVVGFMYLNPEMLF